MNSIFLDITIDVLEEAWHWLWKGDALGLGFELVSPILSLWSERWWFFLHLSHVEASAFLQFLVWCLLRNLRHRQCCFPISHLWLIANSWNTGQAARWCFVLQLSGQVSSSGSSPIAALFSVFLGVLYRRLSFLSSDTMSDIVVVKCVNDLESRFTGLRLFISRSSFIH